MSALDAFGITLNTVFRDKGALGPALIGGILYCFFYPLPYLSQTVHQVPIVVADYDHSALSRQFARELGSEEAVRVQRVVDRVDAAAPSLQRLEIGGIVAIPPNFRRDVLRGTPTGVSVLANGGYIVVDETTLASASAALAATVSAPLAAHLIEARVQPAALLEAAREAPALVKQPLFNTVQGYESYVVPASTGLIVHQLLVIAICLVMGTWIEGGSWPIAPSGRLTFGSFLGMLAAFAAFASFALIFWIGFVFWYHDLPRAGNLLAAVLMSQIYALSIAAVGVALGCWMADRERAFQVIGAISIPLLFLSGFAFPVESIPRPLIWMSWLLPSTTGIQMLLKFNQMGASFGEAAPECVRLSLVTVLYVALAWTLARRRAKQVIAR